MLWNVLSLFVYFVSASIHPAIGAVLDGKYGARHGFWYAIHAGRVPKHKANMVPSA